jgi:hypothetical protein
MGRYTNNEKSVEIPQNKFLAKVESSAEDL